MTHSYKGDGLTIQAEAGERVRYRLQQMNQPRDTTKAYTELKENESVTMELNKNLLQCLEVETADGKTRYYPPRESTQWKVFIEKENTKLRVLGQWGDSNETEEIHLSHIYMNVDGKKVYLSSTEKAQGRKAQGRNEWQWRIHSAQSPSFHAEEYCKEFVKVIIVYMKPICSIGAC